MNIDTIALIVSYLDRYDDLEVGIALLHVMCGDLTKKEKKYIIKRWREATFYEHFNEGRIPRYWTRSNYFDEEGGEWWTANGKLHREKKDANAALFRPS